MPAMKLLLATGLALLTLSPIAQASNHHGYLHLAKGERAISRYLERDVREGAASGYRYYDCARWGVRHIVCSADEYDATGWPTLDGQLPDVAGIEVVATLRPRGWITVTEPDLSSAAFRTR